MDEAGGEHWHTRWQVEPFPERKCVDYLHYDPVWCGGISEWLEVCQLVRQDSGVKVVPHITSPWIAALVRQHDGDRLVPHGHHVLAAAHCVAFQPESLYPTVEYGVTFTKAGQAQQTRVLFPEAGRLEMPAEPGLGPGIDWNRTERV